MTALRHRMIEDMELRNFSSETIKGHLYYVSQFAQHFGKSPDLLVPAEAREYQLSLLKERKNAYASLKQTVAALRFFYKVTLGRPWALEHLRYPRDRRGFPVSSSHVALCCVTSASPFPCSTCAPRPIAPSLVLSL